MKEKSTQQLLNKVSIITGGTGLLGMHYVETLAAAGSKVAIVDIDTKNNNRLDLILNKYGDNVLNLSCDITRVENVKNTVKSVIDHWGKIDILVNNAAINPSFDQDQATKHSFAFEDYPINMWQQSINVNLTGAFICAQQVGKMMVAQNKGVIVNIASTYGLVGPDQRLYNKSTDQEQTLFKPVCYSVTKGGIIQLTRYLATYWGKNNIRVNTLSPGGIKNNQDEEFINKYNNRTPMGRMANPSEMSSALLFLVSDASSYMTGSNLVVDGGWTAW